MYKFNFSLEPRRSESILHQLLPHVPERNLRKTVVSSTLTTNSQNTENFRKAVNVCPHGLWLHHAHGHVPHHDRVHDLFHGRVPAHIHLQVLRVHLPQRAGTNPDLHRLRRHVLRALATRPQRRRNGSTRKEKRNRRVKGVRNKSRRIKKNKLLQS